MNIVVGVTGSIAAYKALDLVNQLRKSGHHVKVILTKNASEFVGTLSFEALSHNACITDMFDGRQNALSHIELGKWANLCIIAPADANCIAKLAHGLADDFLTSFILAFDGPVLLAPAMNTTMYRQPITQANIRALEEVGYDIITPESGLLACGDEGEGKLASIDTLLFFVKKAFTKPSMQDIKVVVTAGPTIGKIDPVRYITNYSSGKMGFSIAEQAALKGADVTLISGQVERKTPFGVSRVAVSTTEEMKNEVERLMDDADVLIMAAAPADYAPSEYHEEKIKKSSDEFVLSLRKNVDILKYLAPKLKNKITVGFAAESHELIKNAQKKLAEKNLDFIVANSIAGENSAFRSDYNAATLLFRDGQKKVIERQLKQELANIILDEVMNIYNHREES